MKREVDYQWRLGELMARRGMHNSTDLAPLLRERGVDLSASQVYRIVTQRPERVSLRLLAAICDIFDCGPEDLITVTAADARRRKASGNASGNAAGNVDGTVVSLHENVKPLRARVRGAE